MHTPDTVGIGLFWLKTNKPTTTYILVPSVLPSDPFHSISRVAEPITASKLLSVPISMTALGTNQSQEVKFVQVDLWESVNVTHVIPQYVNTQTRMTYSATSGLELRQQTEHLTWRYSDALGKTAPAGHHAPSPSPVLSLGKKTLLLLSFSYFII